jgi:hypothetical protein
LKQQARKGEEVGQVNVPLRVVAENSFEVESSGIQIKDLQKIIKKARLEVE